MIRIGNCAKSSTGFLFVLLFACVGLAQDGAEKQAQGGKEKGPEQRAAQELTRKGLREAERGQWESAVRAYSFAIKTDPDFAPAYLNRALAYHKLQRDREAKADLAKYLKFNPKDADRAEVKSLLAAFKGAPTKPPAPTQQTVSKGQHLPAKEGDRHSPSTQKKQEAQKEEPKKSIPKLRLDERTPTPRKPQPEKATEPIETRPAADGRAGEESDFLITAGDEGAVVIWDTNDWSQTNVILAHKKGVRAMALSRDNKYVATGGKKDKTFKVWEIQSGEAVTRLPMEKSVDSIDFSPDGESVAVLTSDHVITIIDTKSWRQKGRIEAYKSERIAFAPDSEQIISLRKSKQIDIFSVHGELSGRIWTSIRKDQRDLAFSPDGRLACSGRKIVQIIDVRTRGAAEVYHISGKGRAIAFSPDGKYLACGSDEEIILWELIGERRQSLLQGHEDDIVALSFSKAGRFLASASRDKTVRIWKVDTKELVTTLRSGDKTVQAVAFSR